MSLFQQAILIISVDIDCIEGFLRFLRQEKISRS